VTDEDLLVNAVAGDMDALAQLLKKYGPEVRAGLKGQIGEKYRAAFDLDDVMSVTYCEAFRGIPKFSPKGTERFVAWLRATAKNNLLDAIKELDRGKRIPRSNILAPRTTGDESYVTFYGTICGTGTTASQHMAKGEAKSALETAIAQLPPDYQKVVRLYDLEGMSISEVADVLGRSQGAVYMIRARAIDALAALLQA